MITVLIERMIADGMSETYTAMSRKALQHSYAVPGFISGEALTDKHDLHRHFILCKWRTEHDWNLWFRSEERKRLVANIAPTLRIPEKITVMQN